MVRRVWLAFAALCILSATSWVVPRAEGLPALELQGLRYGLIGLVAFLFVRGRVRFGRVGLRVAAAGMGFFGVPMVVGEWARVGVPEISRSALFAMVPVVVVMVVAAGDEERGARRFLVPALVGLGGLLLLLPLEFSGSLRGRLMQGAVCLAVVSVGLSSVWLYRLLRGLALAETLAVVGLSNGVFLLVSSAVREEFVWRWSGLASVVSLSSLVDVAEVVLLMWLLREMMPVRFAARYLVIPLLTLLESYALMRPELTVRVICGVVLLAAGAGMLLALKTGEEETMLSLR
ncbi:hypothetical protein [Tunturiibacter gelidoferens]|uniref:Uncharacterized protein n=1 Tax=Tunturiibacter gelidiferens TaxID=3069689 RepID=A0ACC5NV83_9BACT|nr:hypothetical protein [Edaphobacter lichenicola]MBB5338513.1 hypothetical protein [Edaphobacter lichenicola]